MFCLKLKIYINCYLCYLIYKTGPNAKSKIMFLLYIIQLLGSKFYKQKFFRSHRSENFIFLPTYYTYIYQKLIKI